jgi:hypothetical protein
MSGSVLLPSPDGRIVYTETAVYTDELRHLFPRDTNHWKPFTPAAHGNFFLRVRGFEREGRLHPSQEERIRNDVLIYLPGQELPALTLTGIDGAFGNVGGGNPLTRDKRLHLLPAARLLISIPGSNDRLLVRRLDIEAELKRAGKDYLYVDSLPPGGARPGEVWTYRPVVRSNKGGVQFQLDDGPPGMKVAADGTLTWTPPEAGPPAGVILSVSDAGGGRIFHTFEIAVVP